MSDLLRGHFYVIAFEIRCFHLTLFKRIWVFQVVLVDVLLKVIGENKSKRKTHLNEFYK